MRLIRFQAGDGEPRVGILSQGAEGGAGSVTVLGAVGSLAELLALPLARIREICASPAGETGTRPRFGCSRRWTGAWRYGRRA